MSAYHARPALSCSKFVPSQEHSSEQTIDPVRQIARLSAREIAALSLAGLPTSKRGVTLRANADGWSYTEQGGVRLYGLASLPALAQADYLSRQAPRQTVERRSAGRPRGSGFFGSNPDVVDAILVILAERRRPAAAIRKLLAVTFPNIDLPGTRAIQKFIRKAEAEHRVFFTSQRDPDRFKSRFRMALGRADASVSYAHQVWEIDTTSADVLCLEGRKCILGIIDRWSRRARYQVVESESAQSVRRMLVDTISAWGVIPERLKVDNGSGFVNASVVSALELLGIEHDPCLPGHPEDKPFVERLFGTFTRDCAAMLKGFSGHSVAEAQQLRAQAKKKTGRAVVVPEISAAELQLIIDGWINGEYHLRRHSSLGMSPMERWQTSPQPARAAPTDDVLRIALSAYVGQATVGKRGVRWKNGRYWSASLVGWMDKPVILRRDEEDLGALFVFDADGQFIDIAVNWERSGLSEQEFAMAARADLNRFLADQKKAHAQRKRAFSIDAAKQEVLRERAERAGKLVHLPMPTRAHSTAAIESIKPQPVAPRPSRAELDAVLAETAPKPAPRAKSAAEKVGDADAILLAAERGEDVDPTALKRARFYAQSSEYQAEKIMAAEFGRAPPDHGTRASLKAV